ncbi:MAG: IS110 family transposase [Desulfobulbaceae bacterium]|nr:IS110 family transposase [Desulfobulbaceae bacterium]
MTIKRPTFLETVGYVEECNNPTQHRAKIKEAGQIKIIKYIGLDVHKKFITIAIAEPGRDSEVRVYGNIDRVKRLTAQVEILSSQCRLTPLIKAIQSMRGISVIISSIVASELGDLKRFKHPEQLMAYLGLIPSEYSSGGKEKRGAITKTGNGHVRRALIEAAQSYRLPARKSRAIRQRQEGLPEEIKKISWKAQVRLCGLDIDLWLVEASQAM